jgi:hypothetical protein
LLADVAIHLTDPLLSVTWLLTEAPALVQTRASISCINRGTMYLPQQITMQSRDVIDELATTDNYALT